jgi:hypothetical protein
MILEIFVTSILYFISLELLFLAKISFFIAYFWVSKDQILGIIIVMVGENHRNFYYAIDKEGKPSNLQPC